VKIPPDRNALINSRLVIEALAPIPEVEQAEVLAALQAIQDDPRRPAGVQSHRARGRLQTADGKERMNATLPCGFYITYSIIEEVVIVRLDGSKLEYTGIKIECFLRG